VGLKEKTVRLISLEDSFGPRSSSDLVHLFKLMS